MALRFRRLPIPHLTRQSDQSMESNSGWGSMDFTFVMAFDVTSPGHVDAVDMQGARRKRERRLFTRCCAVRDEVSHWVPQKPPGG